LEFDRFSTLGGVVSNRLLTIIVASSSDVTIRSEIPVSKSLEERKLGRKSVILRSIIEK
jgi:hypothetical protein